MKTILRVCAVSSMLFSNLVFADAADDKRFYVAPFGSFLKPAGDTDGKEGWGAGLGFGKQINESFNVETRGFWQSYDNDYSCCNSATSGVQLDGKTTLAGGTVDVLWFFTRDKFSPYAVAAVGAMNTNYKMSGDVNGTSINKSVDVPSFLFETGIGSTYEISEYVSLRSDVRYRLNTLINNGPTQVFNDLTVNLGFVVPLGERGKTAVFEIPVPKAAAPAPVIVAEDCSTLDSDHDGVNNCLDQCPNTISNSRVDIQGCPISLELHGVQFELDSAELTAGAKTVLNSLATSLIDYPQESDLQVTGHTSSEASDAHNMKLSQRRSESVVKYLKAKGVKNNLHAKGYGESQPIADNRTEEGRIRNRRVELIWMGK